MASLLPTGQMPRRDHTRNTYPCHPPHHRLRRRRLGGARNDAASGHGFCQQWQKPQFATRAHHTVVMRITRRSPPTGEAFPSRHSAMRRSRLCPLHPVTCRKIPRRAYPLLGMTRRIEQHFSHVGTSPRRSLFAASSKPFRKRAILLASETAQRTGTCPRYIQQKNPSAGLGFLLFFSLT